MNSRVKLQFWGSHYSTIFHPLNLNSVKNSLVIKNAKNRTSVRIPVHCSECNFRKYLTDSGDIVMDVLSDKDVCIGTITLPSSLLSNLTLENKQRSGKPINQTFSIISNNSIILGEAHIIMVLDVFTTKDTTLSKVKINTSASSQFNNKNFSSIHDKREEILVSNHQIEVDSLAVSTLVSMNTLEKEPKNGITTTLNYLDII